MDATLQLVSWSVADLPEELLLRILSHLPRLRDLIAFGLTCRLARRLAQDKSLCMVCAGPTTLLFCSTFFFFIECALTQKNKIK